MPKLYHTFTDRQQMSGHQFEAFHYYNADGHLNEVALHHHDFYEVYLFLRGHTIYTVENRTYQLMPGDVMLISPLELHQARITPDEEQRYERLVVWIDRSYLEQLCSPRTSLTQCFDLSRPEHSNLLRPTPAGRAELEELVSRLNELQDSDAYGADLLAQSYLVQLLVRLNQLAAEAQKPQPTAATDRVVDGVLEYINEHYSEPITLDDLAARFFISKYHLLRKFDKQVGTSVHRYIQQKRLMIAKQLLSSGVAPTDVYHHCGFGDYANFYRAFKAEYSLTPKQFAQRFGPQ